MISKGFIPISRGLFEHTFWCEKRCYSRFEAWVYLIQDARFEDIKLHLVNTTFVLKRGQLSVSLRFMSEIWGWSTKKVRNFLELLRVSGMITYETSKETGRTLITISNYDTYNSIGLEKETLKKHRGNTKETERKHAGNTEDTRRKEGKERKELKEGKEDKERDEADAIVTPPSDEKVSFPILEEREIDPPVAPPPLSEEENNFIKFQEWINNNASRVAKMKEPFTSEELVRLKKDYKPKEIQEMLKQMHNWADLLKKNTSANITFRKWMSKEQNGLKNANNSRKNTTNIPATIDGYKDTL